MPKVAILLYKEIDYSGYECYIDDIIPIKSTDWFECTQDELNALRKYYKAPPRKAYKLKHMIIEMADHQEIESQLKNCVQIAFEEQERARILQEEKEKKSREAKKKRDIKLKNTKIKQLQQLAKELDIPIPQSIKGD